MHILQATSVDSAVDENEAIDLCQDPADLIILSAADTELAALAQAHAQTTDGLSLRLAHLMSLSHAMSVDIYLRDTALKAKCIVVRVLGGESYWRYGIEQLMARFKGILVFLPGDDKFDAALKKYSTVTSAQWDILHRYFIEGGAYNYRNALGYCRFLVSVDKEPAVPVPIPVPRAGVLDQDTCMSFDKTCAYVPIIFYRALMQGGSLAPVYDLMEGLRSKGMTPVPVYVSSLKDEASQDILKSIFDKYPPALILNTTSFSVNTPGQHDSFSLDGGRIPVLQVILSRMTVQGWQDHVGGLSAKDIAMNIALPEVDGRIITRAVSFKHSETYDTVTQCPIVTYQGMADRIDFVTTLALNWVRLQQLDNAHKNVAVVLANYPNKDSRLANGVGLDVPQSVVNFLAVLKNAGYDIGKVRPSTAMDLMTQIQAGTTNAAVRDAVTTSYLSYETYTRFYQALPEQNRTQIEVRWGAPDTDPFMTEHGFALPVVKYGRGVVVGLQPARGYNIDPKETYHSPDLVPPHNYLAFYFWLRHQFGAHAVIQFGKHGNQEWLPGKSVALSENCFPELVLGPMPHLYPFIVNDPGEGTQAKRRAQAVVVDHLTPPMTRAESYGLMQELEGLLDEYADALVFDAKRSKYLKREIDTLMQTDGLAQDAGINAGDFNALDTYLCELKESQIRDGLHIFGSSLHIEHEADLLVAILRCPRGAQPYDQSILCALAKDLNLNTGFDPLDCIMGDPWLHDKPAPLLHILESPWRTTGDTIERLEELAKQIVIGHTSFAGTHTQAVLAYLVNDLRPAIRQCGPAETQGLLDGLDGRFIPPAPSGAPTRGRPDVLPTGKNFYSVDTRAVPTQAAWHLGWASASALIEQHLQDNGEWLEFVALSVWGTSNMRTGGDDIAQAFALMGVRPLWEPSSRRVTGFEILPLDILDRPRVDVTLRISGFFRDAFLAQIELFDQAVRQVMQLDEPHAQNPLARKYTQDKAHLVNAGHTAEEADLFAGYRIFGSQPGAYGAGLQALVDEDLWTEQRDFAEAFLTWGQYAYGPAKNYGQPARIQLEDRLSSVQAVLHNQDNREHDLLDSDDYYQFEGGMTAAVTHLRGTSPTVYHNDHSRPERPVIRTLEKEIARVMRSRVVNPKWIAGCQRHTYKGAFEMAATMDYLYAFAATTGAVKSHHFDLVYKAYIADNNVHDFLHQMNPCALQDIKKRFRQAYEKGFWQPKSNSALKELCDDSD